MLSGTNEPPQFNDGGTGYWWDIAEDTSIGTIVGTVSATDPEGDPITYALTSGSDVFAIDSTTGAISLIVGLDYETSQYTSFGVSATDSEGNIADSWGDVTITDVNESPVFNNGETGYWWNIAEDTPVGTVVGTVAATDPQGGEVTYDLTSGTGTFSIDSITGEITLITTLDYETNQYASFGVRATDIDGNSSTSWGDVTIDDVNEAPNFTGGEMGYWWSVPEDTAIGTVVGTVSAVDPQGDTVSYALTAGMETFSIDEVTGEITLIAALDYETSQNAYFSATANDGNGNSSTTWGDISVEDVSESTGSTTPVIDSFQLANDTDTPGDNITTDPTITGQVSYLDPMYISVEVDVDGDQITDGLATFDTMTGTFTYSPTGLSIGNNTVAVRAIDEMMMVAGEWATLTKKASSRIAP
jgi:hypothetical protein